MKNPYWIVVNGGATFCGHQGHWADKISEDASIADIHRTLTQGDMAGEEYEIRRMTDNEVARCPESLFFRDYLISKYGEE